LIAHLHTWLHNSFKSAPENPSVNLATKSRGIFGSTGVFLNIALIILNLLF